MRTHIKIVALLNILIGGLGVLGGLTAVIGGTFGSLMSGQFVTAVVGTVASATIGIVIAGVYAVSLVAGFALLNHASWARYVIIVCSALRLFNFPWMTIFGTYSLWVLLSSEGRREFVDTTV